MGNGEFTDMSVTLTVSADVQCRESALLSHGNNAFVACYMG